MASPLSLKSLTVPPKKDDLWPSQFLWFGQPWHPVAKHPLQKESKWPPVLEPGIRQVLSTCGLAGDSLGKTLSSYLKERKREATSYLRKVVGEDIVRSHHKLVSKILFLRGQNGLFLRSQKVDSKRTSNWNSWVNEGFLLRFGSKECVLLHFGLVHTFKMGTVSPPRKGKTVLCESEKKSYCFHVRVKHKYRCNK